MKAKHGAYSTGLDSANPKVRAAIDRIVDEVLKGVVPVTPVDPTQPDVLPRPGT